MCGGWDCTEGLWCVQCNVVGRVFHLLVNDQAIALSKHVMTQWHVLHIGARAHDTAGHLWEPTA